MVYKWCTSGALGGIRTRDRRIRSPKSCVLARAGVSGYFCDLQGFRSLRAFDPSGVYRPVPARLQYGCSTPGTSQRRRCCASRIYRWAVSGEGIHMASSAALESSLRRSTVKSWSLVRLSASPLRGRFRLRDLPPPVEAIPLYPGSPRLSRAPPPPRPPYSLSGTRACPSRGIWRFRDAPGPEEQDDYGQVTEARFIARLLWFCGSQRIALSWSAKTTPPCKLRPNSSRTRSSVLGAPSTALRRDSHSPVAQGFSPSTAASIGLAGAENAPYPKLGGRL